MPTFTGSKNDTFVSPLSSFDGAEDDIEVGRGSIYEGIEDPNEVSKISNIIFNTSSEFGVPIPVVESHYDQNTENFLTRGGKQFANKFALDLLEQSRPSSNIVEVFSIGNQVVGAIEKSGGLKEIPADAGLFRREGRKWLNSVRIVWEMNKAYFFPKKQQVTRAAVKELRGLRPSANFDVPEAETKGEKIVDVTAGLGAFVSQMLVLNKMLPPEMILSDAVAFELLNRADGGLPGKGAVTAGALGAIGKIPVKTITGQLGRLTAQGGLFAGVTAAEGGSPEDIAISFLAPFALKAFGGAKGLVGDAVVGKFFKSKFPSLRIFTNAEVAKANRAAKDWLKVKDGKLSREKWSQKHGEFAVDFARRRAASEAEGAITKPVVEPTAKPTPAKPVTPTTAITKPTPKPDVSPLTGKPIEPLTTEQAEALAKPEAVEGEVVEFEDPASEIALMKTVDVMKELRKQFTPQQVEAGLKEWIKTPEGGAEASLGIEGIAQDATRAEVFARLLLSKTPKAVAAMDRALQPTPTTKPEEEITTKVPPQEPRLEGGKEAGATTIIPDVVTEVSEVSKRLGSTSSEVVGAIKKVYSRNVQRYTTHLKTLGAAGKSVAKDLDEITQRAQVKINNSTLDAKEVLKGVNKANRELIAKTINKRVKDQPKWIVERANKLRKVLDKILGDAKELGIQRLVKGVKIDIGGSGKAFPQVPNATGERMLKLADTRGFGVPEILIAAQDAVEAGKVKTPEEYLIQLRDFYQAQLRGTSGYLERTRVELPEEWIEWDPDRVLNSLFQKNWTFLEGARQWGIDDKGKSFPKLAPKLETIKAKSGTSESQILERFIKAAFGQELLSSEASRNISAAIRGYQFFTKIALSPLTITRNMLDRFNKVAAWAPTKVQIQTLVQYPPFINRFLKHSRQIEEEMIRRGAVFSNTAIAEGYQPGHLLTSVAGKAFASSELGNQVYIALAKRNAIDANIKLLKQNPKIAKIFDRRIGKFLTPLETLGISPTQALKRLSELGDDELLRSLESSADISPDLLNETLHRAVRDNAFPVVLSTKRAWWDNHPFARVMTQFKTWSVEQVGHIWNDVIKDAVQNRDPTKIIRWLVSMAMMGEIYNIIRDFILGRDESLLKTLSQEERRNAKDISVTILKDMVDGGAVGIMADLLYGLPNLIGGPSAATVKNFGDATAKTIWNPSQAKDALAQVAQKETPALKQAQGILDKIEAQFNKDNLTQDYYKVRRDAFEFKFQKQHPTLSKKIKSRAVKAILGWVKNIPTERTFSYEMATRQILSGDIEAASEHMFALLKTAGTDEEQIISIQSGIQSSLRNASPLGPVSDADLEEFLQGMSSKQKKDILNLQTQWDTNTAQAYEQALTKWERWFSTQ